MYRKSVRSIQNAFLRRQVCGPVFAFYGDIFPRFVFKIPSFSKISFRHSQKAYRSAPEIASPLANQLLLPVFVVSERTSFTSFKAREDDVEDFLHR